MNVYLSASISRRPEMLRLKTMIEEKGHKVTSSWISRNDSDFNIDKMEEYAKYDILDIERSELVVVFLRDDKSQSSGRGGVNFELGFAVGREKPVILVGEKVCAFHYMKYLLAFNTVTDFATYFNFYYRGGRNALHTAKAQG